MRAKSVLEAALYVDDLAAAEAFYGDVLGLARFGRVEGRHVFFRAGDTVVLLFDAAATEVPPPADAKLPVPPHGSRGPGHLCFAAEGDEIDAWAHHLRANGVFVEAEISWPQGGRSIYFRDPAGNSLEFAEPRIWGI